MPYRTSVPFRTLSFPFRNAFGEFFGLVSKNRSREKRIPGNSKALRIVARNHSRIQPLVHRVRPRPFEGFYLKASDSRSSSPLECLLISFELVCVTAPASVKHRKRSEGSCSG